jgi:hypothetical protein
MADIKHVGRIKATSKKVLIAYRTLPGDSSNCLVIATENLSDDQHNSLIQLVESPAAQSSYEFAEVLARAKFTDGSTMLPALHSQGRLLKIATDKVLMTPNFQTSIQLNELNQLIAEQRGIAIDDLSIKEDIKPTAEVQEVATVKDISPSAKTTSSSVNQEPEVVTNAVDTTSMTDDQLAKHFRSEADKLSKLAAEMRRQAETLIPTVKKKKETTEP